MKNKLLSIGEVSKISGVHIKSLRYYNEIGVLKPAFVDPDTNYRYYSHKQIGILEAIKTCIELDIPLKEFGSFTDNDGSIIQYSKLLEQGKRLATEKIRSIRKGLKMIELLQRDIERGMEIQNREGPIITDVSELRCYAVPFAGEIEWESYYDAFQDITHEAVKAGYKIGYEIGKMFIYKSGGVEQYNYVEIVSPVKNKDICVISRPAGHCMSKCVYTSRIEHASDEFPGLFSMDYDKIVTETELFSENYNVEMPVFELSCTLPYN